MTRRTGAHGRELREESVSTGLAWLLCLLLAASTASAERIVAIGDIHGAIDGLVAILQESGLIDDQHHWSGGSATLVQTGDFLDRGGQERAVMDLLIDLQKQAESAGGQVIVLIGNHEAMNLLGFRTDVNVATYEAFATEDSKDRAKEAWPDFVRWSRQRAKEKQEPRPRFSAQAESDWKAVHPPGYFEYQDQIGPNGRYGRWLRNLPSVVQLGDVVFLHGGIAPSFGSWSIDRINEQTWDEIERLDRCRAELIGTRVIHETTEPPEMVREGLAELDRLRARSNVVPDAVADQLKSSIRALSPCVDYEEWFLIKQESPLWFRGFARWSNEEGEEPLAELLAAHHAKHFVVGHTPRNNGRIETRFGGGVFLIDTGMLTKVYKGGRASALEIADGQFTAIYEDKREELEVARPEVTLTQEVRWMGPDGMPLPFENDDQVLAYLKTAKITASERMGKGINNPFRLTLEKHGVRAYAIFRSVDIEKIRYRTAGGQFFHKFKDSYRFEPAAYELNRLLGLERVPPAVMRDFRGEKGSIQIWVHNTMDEETRIEKGLQPPDISRWIRERAARKIFDNLIYNVDRTDGNLLIDRTSWRTWLIDHGRSFFEEKELPSPEDVLQCDREVWRRLQETTPGEVRARLEPFLSTYEIDALLARWQELVALLEQRIAEHGAGVVLYDLE